MKQEIRESLQRHSRYPVPENVLFTVRETLARYGKLRLVAGGDSGTLLLEVEEEALRAELASNRRLAKLLSRRRRGFS